MTCLFAAETCLNTQTPLRLRIRIFTLLGKSVSVGSGCGIFNGRHMDGAITLKLFSERLEGPLARAQVRARRS